MKITRMAQDSVDVRAAFPAHTNYLPTRKWVWRIREASSGSRVARVIGLLGRVD